MLISRWFVRARTVLALTAISAVTSGQVRESWAVDFDSEPGGWNDVRDSALDSHGNLLAVATVYGRDLHPGADIVTLKFNPHGQLLWSQRYDGPQGLHDLSSSIVVDAQGNSYVAGSTNGAPHYDILLLKHGPDGHLLWTATDDGTLSLEDIGTDAALDSSGNVYVAGYTRVSNFDSDFVLLKYDPAGQLAWMQEQRAPPGTALYGRKLCVDGMDRLCRRE